LAYHKSSHAFPCKPRARHMQPLCLALLARKPASGYDLLAELSPMPSFSGIAPDLPGLYRALQALERASLIVGRNHPSKKNRVRREYTLLPAGRASLQQWLDTMRQAQEELSQTLQIVERSLKKAPVASRPVVKKRAVVSRKPHARRTGRVRR